ncbi:MAG: hypothetical protein KDB63_17275 [Nocardioidaceae bacterium]|nr:hypothetical protein [Nocardioidaceae bacterium]
MLTSYTTYDRVVVAGGSIAGLLAAAALAPVAREVVVLDRDPLPDPAPGTPPGGPRPGTPQAGQVHGLLASGRLAIQELLPGFTEELVSAGAVCRGDIGTTGRWWIGGGLLADGAVGAAGIAVSRRLVEETIRRRVRALPRVEIRDHVEVVGLVNDPAGDRVTGLRVRDRRGGGATVELGADLVVDATGRPSRGSRWLAELGRDEPPLERVRVGIRYATTHVARREGDLGGRYVSVSAATPEVPRVGVAIAQEDDTWVVAVCGYTEDPPPVDPDGFRQYASGVVAPDLAELLADRELLHPVLTYRFPDCRRRRFDRVRLPLGFVPIGDTIASFDPTFGQGMSVAALEALLLGREAGTGMVALRERYPRAAMAIADRAWTVVTGADLLIPGVEGTPPPGHRLVSRYVARVQRTARHDSVVAAALMRVTNLLDAPTALMRPAILGRVVRPNRASARRRAAGPALTPAA